MESHLQTIYDQLSLKNTLGYCIFLKEISCHTSKSVYQGLAIALVKALSNEPDAEPRDYSKIKNLVIVLFQCLTTLKCEEQLFSFIKTICAKPKRYPVCDTLVCACVKLFKENERNELLQQLFSYCISSLEASSSPTFPANWSLDATFLCSCEDCKKLKTFLQYPIEHVQQFQMQKERRLHLESQLAHISKPQFLFPRNVITGHNVIL